MEIIPWSLCDDVDISHNQFDPSLELGILRNESAFTDDQNKINEIVETNMKKFDLIMISDYMDESQVSYEPNT